MAFKRKDIEALGIDPDKVQILVEWHTETVKALQAQISDLEDKSGKTAEVQAELDKVKAELKTANEKIEAAEKDDYKGKYESEKAAHDKLKTEIATKETTAKKADVFKAYLKEQGYSENAINKIAKYGGYVDSMELDDKGAIKDLEALATSIKAEWAEYTPKSGVERHEPPKAHSAQPEEKNEVTEMMQRVAAKYNEERFGITPDDSNKEG